jgi:hypothetical protein
MAKTNTWLVGQRKRERLWVHENKLNGRRTAHNTAAVYLENIVVILATVYSGD